MLTYANDMVLCIDGTGSMKPVIKEVKLAVKDFPQRVITAHEKMNKMVDTLRIKVIVFRDYYDEEDRDRGISPMEISDFFLLPQEVDNFATFVEKIEATGGNEELNNGLESLSLAMDSEWVLPSTNKKVRHVIFVFTNIPAYPLERTPKPQNYPQDMPKDLNELTDKWYQKMSEIEKRLVLFAPDAYPWGILARC